MRQRWQKMGSNGRREIACALDMSDVLPGSLEFRQARVVRGNVFFLLAAEKHGLDGGPNRPSMPLAER